MRRYQWILAIVLAVAPGLAQPSDAREGARNSSEAQFFPASGERGMVSSQDALASRVGAQILASGGNAIDAAVATGFALAVTLPRAGNLGGGGFMIFHLAATGKTIAIDYREMAPSAASPEMFLTSDGDVDRTKILGSGLASGVPGTVAGLVHVQRRYGRLPLIDVLSPAIALARNGFKVPYALADSLEKSKKRLQADAGSAAYFYKPSGVVYVQGETLVQTDLADTLSRISKFGAEGFYQGAVAEKIVAQMARSGGVITRQDLKNYRVVEREPVCGNYREHQVCSMPPPSSGGIHLVQMLNILEGWNLRALGHNSADYIHRLAASMQRAYADRSQYLGDPDFVDVPQSRLTDKRYAESLRQQIDVKHAIASAEVAPGLREQRVESTETTHFSTWDAEGNAVSNTYTLNWAYGSGIAVIGAGFLLNNEMDDFAAKPGARNSYNLVGGEANAIAPAKRPLSSMTPTLVFDKKGLPLLATGSPGGSTIITVVLQVVLNFLDFNMNIAEATAAPRIHYQWIPDQLYYEVGISKDTLHRLKNMGHNIGATPRRLGAANSIAAKPNGGTSGIADYRREDAAAVAESIRD